MHPADYRFQNYRCNAVLLLPVNKGEDGQGREGIGASLLKPTACG